ncbi:hypothetical protein TSAR_010742 [Trichomalopsis sarcophagae]|uniref:Uncharacterized protein n=1 Tax=Trichomalopsis sarcophagae TaxID=543379 RepID=A0A232EZ90_9HYME|nr:hypothetical protein TSAR_010742 [Trichomalopsis sarcophagae]
MRILSVAEINMSMEEAADAKVAAILNSSSPIKVAPLVEFAAGAYESPQPLYPDLMGAPDDDGEDNNNVKNENEEEIDRVCQAREAEELAERVMARQAEAWPEEEAARVRLLEVADKKEDSEEGEEVAEEDEADDAEE